MASYLAGATSDMTSTGSKGAGQGMKGTREELPSSDSDDREASLTCGRWTGAGAAVQADRPVWGRGEGVGSRRCKLSTVPHAVAEPSQGPLPRDLGALGPGASAAADLSLPSPATAEKEAGAPSGYGEGEAGALSGDGGGGGARRRLRRWPVH
ncbi:hypothetical protein OsJ_02118 [Oryza sativa Japonica Group]|nr:hypothetical protein OsJ_02118 [Oryza sativa Japonica Group]